MTNTWNAGARSLDTTLFDAMNRRKTVQWQDGSSWGYGYNDRGEVIAGNRKWSDAALVNGQQYAYSFDTIGNRTGTVTNGRTASYGADAGNRLTTRDVPGAVDVLGTASPLATVTVNGAAAARHGDYFYKELPVTNSTAPTEALPAIAATRASGTTTRTGRVFVPKTPEAYSYDFDGNQQTDGRATYTWDPENRLIGIETLANVPAGSRVKLAFAYDARHRRIRKQGWRWQSGAWALHHTIRFAYDGWNLLAELGDAGQPLRTYSWGLDLSGTPQGAGGVGGLLFVQDATEAKTFSAAYDLNGNLVALVDQATGVAAAQYEYGPFGELIRESGQYAPINPFRFSTKYADEETGLLYYGFRYYNAATGRWVSRDPLEEVGGVNLYGLVGNCPLMRWDYLGLMDYPFKNLKNLGGGGDPREDWYRLVLAKGNVGAGLPAKMLRHWFFGKGQEFYLTDGEWRSLVREQHVKLLRSRRFFQDLLSAVGKASAGGIQTFSGTYDAPSYALISRTIGNFNVRMKVTVSVCGDAGNFSFTAKGTMGLHPEEKYDFNPAQRPSQDETDVRKMRWLQSMTGYGDNYFVRAPEQNFDENGKYSGGDYREITKIEWKAPATQPANRPTVPGSGD